jgi:hypothetical protein
LAAFQVASEQQLIPGRYARGKIGDFRIGNEHLTAVIGAPTSSLWGPFGGGIIDLVPAGGEDRFMEQFAVVGFVRALRPDKVEVLKDGSDGEAIIRVTGTDGPIPVIEATVKSFPLGFDATVEYILKSDSHCLTIRTTVKNTSDSKATVVLGDGIVFAEAGRLFGAKAGYGDEAIMAESALEYVGSELADETFLLAPAKGVSMSVPYTEGELVPILYDFSDLDPGSTRVTSRCLYVAQGRSVSALEYFWTDRGVELFPVTGEVAIVTPGYDLGGLALEVTTDGVFSGTAAPEADGTFHFMLPAGSYEATAVGDGLLPAPIGWEVDSQGAEGLLLDPVDPGRLDVTITAQGGDPAPSRISIQPGWDAGASTSLLAVAPTLDGKASFFLAPADYTVLGSHGPRWSLCKTAVEVPEGAAASAECSIELEIPADGWVSGDLHVHSEFSIDTQVPAELRVTALLAEGLGFYTPTEHDVFVDYAPIVAEMGLSDSLPTAVGSEISPILRHFNCLGCSGPLDSYFEAAWVKYDDKGEISDTMSAPEVWKMLREDFAATVIQVNHPRSGQGLLDFIDYDPAIGPDSVEPGELDLEFDVIEVWNADEDWGHLTGKTFPDWYSFLNRGHAKAATGNSDSHSITQWVGQPRNLVQAGSASEEDFYAGLLALRSQVTSAPFIQLEIEGKGLGETVAPEKPEGPIQVSLRVSAPTWAPALKIVLVGNGEVVEEWDETTPGEILRFEEEVALTPAQDTWYHAAAYSTGNLSPLYPGRPCIAFTNPIWVDLAGDGFAPPISD